MQVSPRDPRESGRDYALRVIKDNILALELEPGSMVSENELAAHLGLSRTPVREALMALAKVRLVDVYPQRGSAVALVDYELVEETFEGNLPAFIAAFSRGKKLGKAEVDQLQSLIDSYREG